jgi:hypothetical protein
LKRKEEREAHQAALKAQEEKEQEALVKDCLGEEDDEVCDIEPICEAGNEVFEEPIQEVVEQ